MHLLNPTRLVAASALFITASQASPTVRHHPRSSSSNGTCTQTKVAILGAGVAGIAAAQALANASLTDFIIVDRNDYIGGRVAHTTFGQKSDGSPYVVELGANWIQGLGSEGGPENPIWSFSKKHGIDNTYSNFDSLLIYDENGPAEYWDDFDEFDEAWEVASTEAGAMLVDNLQDTNARAGLSLAGWKPRKNMHAQAVEWFNWDFATSYAPEESSLIFGVAGENLTYNQFSDEDNFVWDQRGFNTFVRGEANEFLEEDDPRLLLNTVVTSIKYEDDHTVVVEFEDGSCVEAEHAVCTFSLGVLQNDVVEFDPPLPRWKREAIELFQMGTYTKIFLQFNETFWDPNTEYFLYADPDKRGHYPLWQSLSTPGFIEDSHIIFTTVVGRESYRVEQQTDEETQAEVMEVIRAMFPDVDVPEPTDFMYPRWSEEE
jgi:polyamine oxidase